MGRSLKQRQVCRVRIGFKKPASERIWNSLLRFQRSRTARQVSDISNAIRLVPFLKLFKLLSRNALALFCFMRMSRDVQRFASVVVNVNFILLSLLMLIFVSFSLNLNEKISWEISRLDSPDKQLQQTNSNEPSGNESCWPLVGCSLVFSASVLLAPCLRNKETNFKQTACSSSSSSSRIPVFLPYVSSTHVTYVHTVRRFVRK